MCADERQVRGPRLVEKVLDAAIDELSSKGYASLSIETVAERAGVAKTTIYRRWPTKAALARDALSRTGDNIVRVDETGSTRGDLFAVIESFRTFATSPQGQSLLRMAAAEALGSELATLVHEIRRDKELLPLRLVERAVTRGELPPSTNAQLVVDTLIGAVLHRVLRARRGASNKELHDIVDLVLAGAVHVGAARAATRASTKPARRRSRPRATR